MRARRSDHSSAQLASAQLARSNPKTGASSARSGADAGTLTKGRGADEAAAVEGLPAIAATTIKTMIADPRFPDFLAMSLSLFPLAPRSSARAAVMCLSEAHCATPKGLVRPPTGGAKAPVHSFEGSADRDRSPLVRSASGPGHRCFESQIRPKLLVLGRIRPGLPPVEVTSWLNNFQRPTSTAEETR